MSNLPQQIAFNQYVADGTTTVYIYDYLILLGADIAVYVTLPGNPANPTNDIKILGVDYTVQNLGVVDGGTITFTTPPIAGAIVTLVRNMQTSLDTEFAQVQNFNGLNLDNAFQRVMLLIQQINTINVFRNLGYIINSYFPDLPANTQLPPLANQQIWQMVSGAIQAVTLEENPNVSTLRSQLLSEVKSSDGVSIIGYYDQNNNVPQLLSTFLNNLPTYIKNVMGATDKILQTGMIIPFSGIVAPAGSLLCDGSAVSRTTNANLFNTITFIQSGTLSSGMNTVSGLTSTANMYVGMAVTGTNIPANTTVASIVDSNNITISQTASGSGSSSIRFYSYGAGDGSTTFNVPDSRGRSLIGSGQGVSFVQSGTLTNTMNTVTGLSSTTNMYVGMLITGTNIPANTTVASITGSTSITMSHNASGSGASNISFYLTSIVPGQASGFETIALSAANNGAHTHGFTPTGNFAGAAFKDDTDPARRQAAFGSDFSALENNSANNLVTASSGSGTPFNMRTPYLGVNAIIII